jgi:hypothetical protein
LADAEERHQLGGCGGGEPVQLGGQGLDLEVEGLVAAGEGAQREQGRRQWAGDRAGDQGGRGCHQGGGW